MAKTYAAVMSGRDLESVTGCYNEMPQARWLKRCFLTDWDIGKLKMKLLVFLVTSEDCLP